MTGFVFGWVLRFTHSQKAVLVRNRCVKFAFNNGSFGAYFPAYCEPIKGRFCCNSCLLQSFIKSIMPAYRSIRCSLFANALLSLACCWRWCSVLPCSYCSEKSAIRSPFALCARLWCWWYVCLSNGLTWRYGAIKKGMAKITIPHHACPILK